MIFDNLVEIVHKDDFPELETALDEPDGLLAYGFVLTPEIVLSAYQKTIFPWFEQGQPVLWWSPKKRALIEPENLKISRSLRKSLRNRGYCVSFDKQFQQVIYHCATVKRTQQQSTWITKEMLQCYDRLHEMHKAHSIEVWLDNKLVGGLYGLIINNTFCGESMFSLTTDASKVALTALAFNASKLNVKLIDCQIMNPYLASMGAEEKTRNWYWQYLMQQTATQEILAPCTLPLPFVH